MIREGNPDDWWTQNCPPQDCPQWAILRWAILTFTKNLILPPKNDHFFTKSYNFPWKVWFSQKMVIYALFSPIFIIFDQYLPWFPSEYHIRIIFDHCHFRNIDSQSQNCCFKNFLIFGKKIVPQSARICAIGGVKSQFGQCPNIHGFSWGGAPLIWCWNYNFEEQIFCAYSDLCH